MSGAVPAGVRVEPLAGELSIEIRREPLGVSEEQQRRIDRAWQGLCAQNPRYFDGRILSFEAYDATRRVATARDVAYRYHAARDAVDSGVSFFGVTGLLRAGDRFLVGKRASTVHEYPGQWEFAPCGGIDPPPAAQDILSPGEIAQELRREAGEELGIDLVLDAPRAVALVHDDPVGSTDLMLLIDLPARPETDGNWEYQQARWLTLAEIVALHGAGGEAVIPTTLAMADHVRSMPDET